MIEKFNLFEKKSEEKAVTDDLYFVDGKTKIKVSELIEDNDSFEDIKIQMNSANADSQRNADENEAFGDVLSSVEKVFGKIIKDDKSLWHDNKIYFDIDISEISEMDEKNFEDIGVDNSNTSNNIMGLFEMEYKDSVDEKGINIYEPDYGWNGYINKEDLNDYVVENLENNL